MWRLPTLLPHRLHVFKMHERRTSSQLRRRLPNQLPPRSTLQSRLLSRCDSSFCGPQRWACIWSPQSDRIGWHPLPLPYFYTCEMPLACPFCHVAMLRDAESLLILEHCPTFDSFVQAVVVHSCLFVFGIIHSRTFNCVLHSLCSLLQYVCMLAHSESPPSMELPPRNHAGTRTSDYRHQVACVDICLHVHVMHTRCMLNQRVCQSCILY